MNVGNPRPYIAAAATCAVITAATGARWMAIATIFLAAIGLCLIMFEVE